MADDPTTPRCMLSRQTQTLCRVATGAFVVTQKVHRLEVDTSRGEQITISVRPQSWLSLVQYWRAHKEPSECFCKAHLRAGKHCCLHARSSPRRRQSVRRHLQLRLSFTAARALSRQAVLPMFTGLVSLQLDLTLPRMPCDWLSVTAIDVSGNVQASIDHDLSRERLNARGAAISAAESHAVGAAAGGDELPDHLHPDTPPLPENYCGSCYGAEDAEGQCCNTCEEVRTAYRARGWVLPDYDSVEQCKREGFQDALAAVVRDLCLCGHARARCLA